MCLISVFCDVFRRRSEIFWPHGHTHTNANTIKEWCRSRELSATLINSSVSRVQSQVEKVAHCATLRQSNWRICKFYEERKEKPKMRTVEHCHFSLTAHSWLCARTYLIDQIEFAKCLNELPKNERASERTRERERETEKNTNTKIVLRIFNLRGQQCGMLYRPRLRMLRANRHTVTENDELFKYVGVLNFLHCTVATLKYRLLDVWPKRIRIRALIIIAVCIATELCTLSYIHVWRANTV